ncbi:CD225/dispanin family protein [Micromonospora sp. NPDC050980]|uniref:CD225/dispanin family protein n=1 Tax=Micromonospora sp. NPDC050980 TaxID=3155161 RepID=UPI00340DA3A2
MQPGHPQQQPPQQIDNNMTMSIVAIFLFWPLAIPAIINASKVNPLIQQGDYAGAQAAAAESKKWSKWALIVGLVWIGIIVVCCLFGGLASFVGGSTGTN